MHPTDPGHAAKSASASSVPPLLARVDTPQALRAGLLALLVPSGSRRPALAWQVETAGEPEAPALRDEVEQLQRSARLPWFERLLARMAGQPLAQRQMLLEASRRIMNARGATVPIDTLHWLVMRRRLGERGGLATPASAETSFTQLPDDDVQAIARYTAFLSRLVPTSTAQGNGDAAWYASVMKTWQDHAWVPPCDPAPDAGDVVQALRQLQAMPWMQRPMIVRNWVSAALLHSKAGRLGDDSADALRMSCTLLDSPMPPELAAHYIQLHSSQGGRR
ncbi:MAG: hypothetical protein OEY03_06460 [Rhizobacter sp.]|nr:hypothetical protein [Rhizobacter sp.]